MTEDNNWIDNAESEPSTAARAGGDLVVVVPLFVGRVLAKEQSDVEKINPYAFYQLGLEIQPLMEINSSVDVPKSIALFPLWTASTAMARLLKGEPIKLGVSRSAATAVQARIASLIEENFRDDKGGIKFPAADAPPIPEWQWNSLKATIQTFQTVFRAEMETATTYYVPRRGIYSTADLVENAEETFPPELAPFISQKTKDDFHAAGRCLAFNLPTAAGFHAARGIEGTLETYWQTFTGKTGTLKSWNDYIVALRELAAAATPPFPLERTVETLQLIKDHDRNPVMHPRVVLSEVDARILFSSSESVVLAMAQEIRTAKQEDVQGALSLVAGMTLPS